MTQAYENDRENSINSIQNMMMSAQLIEEDISVFWQMIFGEKPRWRQAFIITSL